MKMYDIKKVKKTSKSSKANYFHHSPQEQTKQQKRKKASPIKSRGHKTFSRFARELERNNLKRNQNYKNLEKRLNIDKEEWGVEKVAAEIIDLISTKYRLLAKKNPAKKDQLVNQVYQEGQTIIKKSFIEARKTILPLPPEVNQLLTATYKLSKQKLTSWKNKAPEQFSLSHTDSTQEPPDLTEKITELFTKQGIYLKEAKTKLPAINLRG